MLAIPTGNADAVCPAGLVLMLVQVLVLVWYWCRRRCGYGFELCSPGWKALMRSLPRPQPACPPARC